MAHSLKIYQWYGSLHRLHLELYRPDSDRAALLASLETLEREADHVEVPLSYMEEYYSLRTHMALVRSRLEERSFLSGEVPGQRPRRTGGADAPLVPKSCL